MHFAALAALLSLVRVAWPATLDARLWPPPPTYAPPGACSGNCDSHDPAIIRRASDQLFYRFWTAAGISIASAPDISGPWTFLGQALPAGTTISGFPDPHNLWAPDVSFHNGMYYMYYAISAAFGSKTSAIGVATSTSLDPGTWTDHGVVISSDTLDPYNAIDPNLIKVGDDYYLTFGSFFRGIYQAKMDSSLLTIASGPSQVPLANTLYGIPPSAIEGAYMYYRAATGYYYLLTSWGQCCNLNPPPPRGLEYNMRVCRSTSVTGNFKDEHGWTCVTPTGLLSGSKMVLQSHDNVYAPGHGGIIDINSTMSVLYYHWMDISSGTYLQNANLFGWNTIDWSSGWPKV